MPSPFFHPGKGPRRRVSARVSHNLNTDATATGLLAGQADGTTAGGFASTLSGIGDLSGTSAGVSAPTGTLGAIGALAGTASGTSTPTGTLTGTGALAGQSNGIAGGTAAATATGALAGTSTGLAGGSATLAGNGALAGSAAGLASSTAGITATGVLAGQSDGVSTASATADPVSTIGDLAGQADGTSTASATADQPAVLTQPVSGGGGGGVFGAYGRTLSQRGATPRTRTTAKQPKAAPAKVKERAATIIGVLAGRASGHSGAYGRLEGVGALAGVVAGVADAYGTIEGIEGDDVEAITLILAMAA